MAEKNLTIDDGIVHIPDDLITLGWDADGLPKTISTEAPKEDPAEAKAAQDKAVGEMTRLRKERDERAREAQEARQEAAQAGAKATHEAAARARAEADAAKNHGYAVNSHMQRMYAEHSQIESGLAAANSSISTLKDMLKRAVSESDGDRVADITEQMALATADKRQFETGKAGIEAEIARQKAAFEGGKADTKKEADPDPEPRAPTHDEWIASCPKATQGWLKEHREFVTDNKLNRKLMRFAEEYTEDNDGVHSLNTSDFIEALNAKFFPKAKEEENAVTTQEKDTSIAEEVVEEPKAKAKVAAAAPVRGGGNIFSSTNPNGRQVKLPPKLAQFVKESGLNYEKYALGAVADIKAGKLPKNFLDPDYPHDF